jgi:hypothetical protein
MISLSSLRRAESKHFPTSIEKLIEQDLQKLQEANQEDVDDDSDENYLDVEEEGNVEEPKEAEGDAEKAEGVAEKAEGDAEKAEGDAEKAEGKEGPPDSDSEEEDDEESKDYFDDEDSDPIILGVRIYTKGGVAVSVTGHVVGEHETKIRTQRKPLTRRKP